jgi:hypothetical protein
MGKKKTFYVGDVYVESGLCYIGDPGSIIPDPARPPRNFNPEGEEPGPLDWDNFMYLLDDVEHQKGEPMDGAPEVLALEVLGKGQGLVFPAGQGDGIYPVYITLDNGGRPEAAYISFKMPPGQA